MMRGVAVFFIVVGYVCCMDIPQQPKSGDMVQDSKETDPMEALLKDFMLTEKNAKSVLRARRVRRGWWGEITGEDEDERESSERNRENGERRREAEHLNRICPSQCWSAYGDFGSCSAPCGSSGVKWQYRTYSPSQQCSSWAAAHGCPGSNKRSDACHRFCHNGGTPRANSCTCSPAYKGICCETRVTCGNPGRPVNGEVTPGGSVHYYGVTVSYSCNVGYKLIGSASRQCQHSGQWTNSVPTCQLIDCGDPGVPSNGNRTGDRFTHGQSVVFTCEQGYRLEGDSVRKCETNEQWSGTQPHCRQLICPVPDAPVNGEVNTPAGITYNQKAHYTCDEGYYLEGDQYRVCRDTEQWSGTTPNCTLIVCASLTGPVNGSVELSSQLGGQVPYAATATYHCDYGYLLDGNEVRTCTGRGPRGTWTGTQPSCRGVDCGDPGSPANGIKLGSDYIFPLGATSFQCNPGFYLYGEDSLICLPSGRWSTVRPDCIACPRDQYKVGTNADSECMVCPEHSRTAGNASIAREQCICKVGYMGPNGGPCELIVCPDLPLPEDAEMGECGTIYGEECHFSCHHGYIRVAGDAVRRCVGTGQWTGTPVQCQACGVDTYKSEETRCTRCPEDSYTDGEGHGKSGCICGSGFSGPPGGPCQDVDECKDGNGGCEQTCENSAGSHRCLCTLPGFIPDSEDQTRCAHKNKCPEVEVPGNGGMVCVMQNDISTQRCQVKCNPGYEHVIRPNGFEECGPSTNWQWSYQLNNLPLLPCYESYFEGIELEAEFFYWVEDCESLTGHQKMAASEEFVSFLRSTGACQGDEIMACSVTDVTVHCTGHSRRRRTAEDTDLTAVSFKVKVKVERRSVLETDCRSICDWQEGSDRYCNRTCQQNYYDVVEHMLKEEIRQASVVFNENLNATILVGESEFRPNPVPPRVTSKTDCGIGMVSQAGKCVECPAGAYTHCNGLECALCPPGTYQPKVGSKRCLPCTQQKQWGNSTCPPS